MEDHHSIIEDRVDAAAKAYYADGYKPGNKTQNYIHALEAKIAMLINRERAHGAAFVASMAVR